MMRLLLLIFLISASTLPAIAGDKVKNCYPITTSDLLRKDAPRFDQYPSKTENVKKPRVNLKSHPDARTYRTMLRQRVAEGPNFAGHYAVVGWGCGTSCLQFAVVEVRTGRVVFPEDFSSVSGAVLETDDFEKGAAGPFWGLRYRVDSRLLIVVGMLDENEKREGAFYYLLEKGKLKRIFSVTVKKDDCDARMKD